MNVLVSESLDSLGSNAAFSIEPIMVDMEGGRYFVPILPDSLADLVANTRGRGDNDSGGSSRGSDGSATSKKRKASSKEGGTQVYGCIIMCT